MSEKYSENVKCNTSLETSSYPSWIKSPHVVTHGILKLSDLDSLTIFNLGGRGEAGYSWVNFGHPKSEVFRKGGVFRSKLWSSQIWSFPKWGRGSFLVFNSRKGLSGKFGPKFTVQPETCLCITVVSHIPRMWRLKIDHDNRQHQSSICIKITKNCLILGEITFVITMLKAGSKKKDFTSILYFVFLFIFRIVLPPFLSLLFSSSLHLRITNVTCWNVRNLNVKLNSYVYFLQHCKVLWRMCNFIQNSKISSAMNVQHAQVLIQIPSIQI